MPDSDSNSLYLIDVLRHVPTISPQESVQRFLDLLSITQYPILPVVDEGKFVGCISVSDVRSLLTAAPEARRHALREPVGDYCKYPDHVISPRASVYTAEQILGSATDEMLPVVDEDGDYCGVICARDLLGSRRVPLRLPTIGGMATPFGVYLSDGVNQAGAGNWALISSGAVLGLLAVLSSFTSHAVFAAVGKLMRTDLSYLTEDFTAPAGDVRQGLLVLFMHLCSTALFLVMVRSTKIAGYHAAEHQTVHAIEHGEELVPEIVSRMPRPHPRCGTNLMAAGILFWNLSTLIRTFPGFDPDSATLAAILITMVYWRRFGRMLQSVFTTKEATEQELTSGIAAAEQLISAYRSRGPRARTVARRVWCSGLIQSMVGLVPMLVLLSMLLDWWQK